MTSREHMFSWQALFRIVAVGVLVFLIWKSLSIWAIILVALVVAGALYPMAKKLNKKLPMLLSTLIVIIVLLIPIIALVTITALTFTNQFPQALDLVVPLLDKFNISTQFLKDGTVLQYIQSNTTVFLTSTKQILFAVGAILSVIFLVFYFIYDGERLFKMFVDLFPKKEEARVAKLMEEISVVTGQYIRGNLLISIICIGVIYGGLVLLKVPFALPLAIFAGIMDLLPYIGPVIGAVPAVVLGFAISPLTGILTLVLYVVYQQIENVFIGPAIYNKALNLSAALVFVAVIIGGGMFGIIGVFMALPVAASIPVILRYRESYLNRHPKEDSPLE